MTITILGDMFPCFVVRNHAHGMFRYPVLLSQFLPALMSRFTPFFSNCANGSIGQLGIAMMFPKRHLFRMRLCDIASFSRTILHVILLCAKEQMGRIAAHRIVTGMTDIQSCGDPAINKFPCQSVRKNVFPGAPSPANSSIPIAVRFSKPRPTRGGTGGLVYLCPEARFKWHNSWHRTPPEIRAPRRVGGGLLRHTDHLPFGAHEI